MSASPIAGNYSVIVVVVIIVGIIAILDKMTFGAAMIHHSHMQKKNRKQLIR